MTPGTVSSHRSSPSAMTGFWTLPRARLDDDPRWQRIWARLLASPSAAESPTLTTHPQLLPKMSSGLRRPH